MQTLPTKQMDWKPYIQESMDKTAEAIVQVGVRMLEFKGFCESTSGGSMYSSLCNAWFGMDHTTASRWASIGKNESMLLAQRHKLPPSMRSIAELCQLDAVPESITDKSTVKEVQAVVKEKKMSPEEIAAKKQADQDNLNAVIEQSRKEKLESGPMVGEASPIKDSEDAKRVLGIDPLNSETLEMLATALLKKYKSGHEHDDIVFSIDLLRDEV